MMLEYFLGWIFKLPELFFHTCGWYFSFWIVFWFLMTAKERSCSGNSTSRWPKDGGKSGGLFYCWLSCLLFTWMSLVMCLSRWLWLFPRACRWPWCSLVLNWRDLTRVRNLFVRLRNWLLMIRYPFRMNSACPSHWTRYRLIGLGEVLLLRGGTLGVYERRVLLSDEDLRVVEIVRRIMAQSKSIGIVFLLL